MLFLANLVVKAQRRRPVTGPSGMIDGVGRTLTPIEPGGSGHVTTHGEIWTATSNELIPEGESVRVIAVEGMTLTVRHSAPAAHGGQQ